MTISRLSGFAPYMFCSVKPWCCRLVCTVLYLQGNQKLRAEQDDFFFWLEAHDAVGNGGVLDDFS